MRNRKWFPWRAENPHHQSAKASTVPFFLQPLKPSFIVAAQLVLDHFRQVGRWGSIVSFALWKTWRKLFVFFCLFSLKNSTVSLIQSESEYVINHFREIQFVRPSGIRVQSIYAHKSHMNKKKVFHNDMCLYMCAVSTELGRLRKPEPVCTVPTDMKP